MMNWQGTLATLLGRKAARRLIALDRIGQPLWSPRRYDRFADEGFRKNVIAFRSISEVAQAAASVPWRLRRRRGDEWVEVNSHPLLALLRRPNPLQGGPALFESAYAFRFIAGNAFIEAVAPEGRPPVELYALRPDRMRVIPGAAGLPAAYRYGVGGRTRDYPVDQVTGRSAILHFRAFHRLPNYGCGKICHQQRHSKARRPHEREVRRACPKTRPAQWRVARYGGRESLEMDPGNMGSE